MLNGLEESCVSARSLLRAGIEGASADGSRWTWELSITSGCSHPFAKKLAE